MKAEDATGIGAWRRPRGGADAGTLTIGGIPTVRATRGELAAMMVADHSRVRSGETLSPRFVVSSNGQVIAAFHQQPAYRELLLHADIIDADGMPLVLASRLFCKHPLRERTATTDFVHDAARAAVAAGIRFYFLGGRHGVARAAANNLVAAHPGLQIAGIHHGYFNRAEEPGICAEVRASGADVLWIGLGSPAQEAFVVRNRDALSGLTWLRTCGGLFDHLAGRFRRAPPWMQTIGLEWIFRLVQEPRRLGPRYLVTNPVALFYLLTKTHD